MKSKTWILAALGSLQLFSTSAWSAEKCSVHIAKWTKESLGSVRLEVFQKALTARGFEIVDTWQAADVELGLEKINHPTSTQPCAELDFALHSLKGSDISFKFAGRRTACADTGRVQKVVAHLPSCETIRALSENLGSKEGHACLVAEGAKDGEFGLHCEVKNSFFGANRKNTAEKLVERIALSSCKDRSYASAKTAYGERSGKRGSFTLFEFGECGVAGFQFNPGSATVEASVACSR